MMLILASGYKISNEATRMDRQFQKRPQSNARFGARQRWFCIISSPIR